MSSKPLLLVTLIWIPSLLAWRGLLAHEASTVPVSLVSAASVSDRFQRETQAATQSIPLQVWKTLDAAGWRVQLAEFVVDAAPSLRGVRPPGWPRHLTWDNSDAISLPMAKLLVVAEKRRNRSGEIVASSRVAGVLRHEIGHAFDLSAARGSRTLSNSSRFVQAYQQDRSRIDAKDRDAFAYYLQDGANGFQETFAEAFAVILGGGSSDIAPAEFETRFPRVTDFTRAAIAKPVIPAAPTTRTRVAPVSTVRWRLRRRR